MSVNNKAVLNVLLQKGFGNDDPPSNSGSNKRFTPPAEAMHITVDIDLIKPYENNPRKADNDKYEEIKESIREIGLQQPFSITSKPGTEHYIIRSGGNTRLKALKELFKETGDLKFKKITCHYQPYTDDLELLSLHMMENEQRGKMLFVDVSNAVKTFKNMLENVRNETINYRKLAEEMKQRGWSIHYPNVGFYLYAAEISDDLRQAFNTGLGRKLVGDIKKLEDHIVQWAKDKDKDADKCLQYFKNVLRENDAPAKDLNLRTIENGLYTRLASQFNLTFNDIHSDFILIKDHGSLFAEEVLEHESEPQTNNEATAFSPHSSALETHLPLVDDLPSSVSIRSQKSSITPTGGETKPSAQQKVKNELIDHFNWMIRLIDKFEGAFHPTNDDRLFEVKHLPSEFLKNKERPFFTSDVLGVWYLIYVRLETIKIVIEFKNNPMSARDKLFKLMEGNYLNQHSFLPCIIPESFTNNTGSILPSDLFDELCPMIQPEIRKIFQMRPHLDQKMQNYLSYLRTT